MVYILGVCTLPEWQEYLNGLSKFLTGSTRRHLLYLLAVMSISDLWKLKKKKKMCVCEHNTHADTNMCIFILSWSLRSQFIEVSQPQVEAFNLDSGVTQPQLSPAAAAAIVPRLKIQWKSSWIEWNRVLNDKRERDHVELLLVCAFYTHLRKILPDDPDEPTETSCALQRCSRLCFNAHAWHLRFEKGERKISEAVICVDLKLQRKRRVWWWDTALNRTDRYPCKTHLYEGFLSEFWVLGFYTDTEIKWSE